MFQETLHYVRGIYFLLFLVVVRSSRHNQNGAVRIACKDNCSIFGDVLVSICHIDDENYLPPLSASSLLSPGPSLHNSPWHRVKYLAYVSVVTT